MTYKTVSSQEIISRVFRIFKPEETDWSFSSAFESIGDTIDDIGFHTGYRKTSKELEICDYRHKLPCDLSCIRMVEYQGNPLRLGSDETGYGLVDEPRTTNIQAGYSRNLHASNVQQYTAIDHTVSNPEFKDDPYYLINPDYIQTSFRQGIIKLHYNAYYLDEDGFPLVPDDYNYKQACAWGIMSNLLLGGMKHPTINYEMASDKYDYFVRRARNSAKTSSIDQKERFKATWKRLIPLENAHSVFFTSNDTPENLSF